MDNERLDTAAEPVDHQDENEFMDTGVLHERPKSKGVKGAHVARREDDAEKADE